MNRISIANDANNPTHQLFYERQGGQYEGEIYRERREIGENFIYLKLAKKESWLFLKDQLNDECADFYLQLHHKCSYMSTNK